MFYLLGFQEFPAGLADCAITSDSHMLFHSIDIICRYGWHMHYITKFGVLTPHHSILGTHDGGHWRAPAPCGVFQTQVAKVFSVLTMEIIPTLLYNVCCDPYLFVVTRRICLLVFVLRARRLQRWQLLNQDDRAIVISVLGTSRT